ncbi:MAG: HAD family hydrolase [Hungatella sp.]
MYPCCIFDLDGTLINTIYALTKTVNLTLDQYGLGPIDDEQTKIFVGDGYRKLLERALIHCEDSNLVHLPDALMTYNEFFRENCLYRIEAYEGIRELLAYLKSQGIRIAVCSNKAQERAEENLEAVFGAGYFDLILGEREGIAKKPDPSGVFLIAETFGLQPSDCLYLGDTNTDMKTGLAAGMDTVGVTWGFRTREELEAYHPKYVLDDPREVIPIMAGE